MRATSMAKTARLAALASGPLLSSWLRITVVWTDSSHENYGYISSHPFPWT